MKRARLLAFRLLLVAVAAALQTAPVLADEIYRWTDAQGNVHYSTKREHPQAAPAALPKVSKENLDERIRKIRSDTPPNCEGHGGEDCTKGADTDGSVICLDGFRDAVLPFRFHCMEVRLNADISVLFNADPKVVRLNKAFEGARQGEVTGLQITVRNLSAVEALGVKAEVEVPARLKLKLAAEGPEKVEPFGLADYTVPLDLKRQGISTQMVARAKVRVRCENCSAVIRTKRSK